MDMLPTANTRHRQSCVALPDGRLGCLRIQDADSAEECQMRASRFRGHGRSSRG